MKYNLVHVFFTLVILCSCKEQESLGNDPGCITQLIIPVTSHDKISDVDYLLIQSLFKANGRSVIDQRFTRISQDSVWTYVEAIPYSHGLPIFDGNVTVFRDGIFNYFGGHTYKDISLSPLPVLAPGQLRKLFIDDLQRNNHWGSLETDSSCLNVELGYLNTKYWTAGDTTTNIVRAWHVTTKRLFPEAYYQDGDGKLIYYFDGIISFNDPEPCLKPCLIQSWASLCLATMK